MDAQATLEVLVAQRLKLLVSRDEAGVARCGCPECRRRLRETTAWTAEVLRGDEAHA